MSYSPFHHFVRIALVLITLLLMQACSSHSTLFSGLSEEDGNEIYAQLLAAQIPAEKTKDKNGIQISVPQPMGKNVQTPPKSKNMVFNSWFSHCDMPLLRTVKQPCEALWSAVFGSRLH